MKIGDRIKELRKVHKLTQLQLANELDVTDKAVSKWESNLGEPNVGTLMKLSELFNVTTDYLLTGDNKEKIVHKSLIERIAYEDNLELFISNHHVIDHIDENHKSLVDYIYEYEAANLFLYIAKSNYKQKLSNIQINNRNDIENLIKMSFITKYYELLLPNVKYPFKALYTYEISNKTTKQNKLNQHVNQNIFDFILFSEKMNEESWIFLLDTSKIYWNNGLSFLLEKSVSNNHKMMLKIIDTIENTNNEIMEMVNNSFVNNNGRLIYEIKNNFVYKGNEIVRILTDVTKVSVNVALKNNDYALADRLNKMSNYKVSEYEIKMEKIRKDKTLSKKEKLIESTLHQGIVHIDELISLDDFDLYLKVIKYPASHLEKLQMYLEKEENKKLFQEAVDLNLGNTKEAMKLDRLGNVSKTLIRDFYNKEYKPNEKYLYVNQYNREPIGKNGIYFEDILNHKDLRFFEHACLTNSKKMDWALEEIIKLRPQDYSIQKILLKNGAKIHKRWTQQDGWGYMNTFDEIDEVATQLLKNQLIILIDEGEIK